MESLFLSLQTWLNTKASEENLRASSSPGQQWLYHPCQKISQCLPCLNSFWVLRRSFSASLCTLHYKSPAVYSLEIRNKAPGPWCDNHLQHRINCHYHVAAQRERGGRLISSGEADEAEQRGAQRRGGDLNDQLEEKVVWGQLEASVLLYRLELRAGANNCCNLMPVFFFLFFFFWTESDFSFVFFNLTLCTLNMLCENRLLLLLLLLHCF